MSLFSQVANGFFILVLILVVIGILLALAYLVGSLLVYICIGIPSIPIEKRRGSIRFRGSESRILNQFSETHGKDIFGLMLLALGIILVIGFFGLVGMVAEFFGVSIV